MHLCKELSALKVTLQQAVCFTAVPLKLQLGQEVKVLCPAQINSLTHVFTDQLRVIQTDPPADALTGRVPIQGPFKVRS